jgi:cobalamin synthase
VLAHGARDAGADEGTKFARAVGSREFAGASVFALALVLLAAEAIGLVVIVASAAATVGLRVWFHHRLGGITTQNLGAVAETVETLALVLFAFVS